MNYFEIADYNPIRQDFKFPIIYKNVRIYKPEEILSDNMLDLMATNGLQVRAVQLFTTRPFSAIEIHVDGDNNINRDPVGALNYIHGATGLMKWYDPLDGSALIKATEVGTVYTVYDPKKCVEIDSLAITKLTLVKIFTPHNVINDSDVYRYCVSIRFNTNSFDFLREKLSSISWNNL